MFPRHQHGRLLDALSDTPVVLLAGARQVGKSTLAKQVAQEVKATYLTLDDATVLAAATADPAGFVKNLPGGVVIDEAQRTPELLLAIKATVDRSREPGRFLLTGSANVLTLPRIADSLAGRMDILRLWPLSQGELNREREDFPTSLFSGKPFATPPPLTEDELVKRMLAGGYPEAVSRARLTRRNAWFDAYVSTILMRDIQDLANIEGIKDMPRLLQLLATRTSNLLNYAALSREIGFPQSTLKRYMDLLEATYLLHTQGSWATNRTKRATKSPKILLNDAGLVASLLDADAQRLRDDRQLLGQLLETFVVLELYKQLGWSDVRARLYHFRSYTDQEVDAVLERPNGRLAGIEVKAAVSLDRKDFRGLLALQEASGERFERGVVLYMGDQIVPFGDRLWALPLSALWQPSS